MGIDIENTPRLTYPGKASSEEVIGKTSPAVLTRVRSFGVKGPGRPGGVKRPWSSRIIRGDNLGVLKALAEEVRAGTLASADGTPGVKLVYMDPPFATNLRFRGPESQRAFDDRLTGVDFIEFLRKRLILTAECLASGGSVFLHLDWKMSHYARVVMDEVFGPESFVNEIVWSYGGRGAKAVSGQFSRNHDTILWYARGPHAFNRVYTERRVKKGEGGFREDAEGRWFKTAPRGDYTDASIAALEREGRVYRTRNGSIRIKYFVREDGDYLVEEVPVGDVWADIADAMHMPKAERTGYPTQKPVALLERIIEAATDPGDLVMDPFSGAGTTLVAAERLGRRWVGIDSGRLAAATAERRLLAGLAGQAEANGLFRCDDEDGRTAPSFVVVDASGGASGAAGAAGDGEGATDAPDCELVLSADRGALLLRGTGAGGLSAMLVDLDHDGGQFNTDLFFDLTGSGAGDERRFALGSRAGARIAAIIVDSHGAEQVAEPVPAPA